MGGVTRALTMHQPWASLFVAGAKMIETRSWQTGHRGPLAVHAAKVVDRTMCHRLDFAAHLEKLGFRKPEDLPLGAILGTVELVDCLKMTEGVARDGSGLISLPSDPRLTADELAFGSYGPRRFAWITGERRFVLAEPIPCAGFQRIWKLPAGVGERLSP